MAHIDETTGLIVIRIVYDGPAQAGKTTNLQALADRIPESRRDEMASPGSDGTRTEYFDWMNVLGGYFEGRRIRCQLVTVPGQPELHARRLHLLTTADSVVFVADAHRDQVMQSRAVLQETLAALAERHDGVLAPGWVLQGNKQDIDDAMEPTQLAESLAIPSTVPVRAASALSGAGVVETFMLGARLALDRVRAMADAGLLQHGAAMPQTPAELFEAMQGMVAESSPAVEGGAEESDDDRPEAGEALAVEEAGEVDQPAVEETAAAFEEESEIEEGDGVEAEVLVEASAQAEREELANEPLEEEARSGTVETAAQPSAPEAVETAAVEATTQPSSREPEGPLTPPQLHLFEIPAGMLWPPVKGRSVLAALGNGALHRQDEPRPWAPEGGVEWQNGEHWVLHSPPNGFCSSEDEARKRLMEAIRAHLALDGALLEDRVLVAAPAGEGRRIWMITPAVESVQDRLEALAAAGDTAGFLEALRDGVNSLKVVLERAAKANLVVTPSLHNLAAGSEPAYLGWLREASEEEPPMGGASVDILYRQLGGLLRSREAFSDGLPGYLRARLSRSPVEAQPTAL